MAHYVPSDISRHYAEWAGKVTRTGERIQQIAKQDERQQEDIQEKEEAHTINSRPEEQALSLIHI